MDTTKGRKRKVLCDSRLLILYLIHAYVYTYAQEVLT